MQDPNHIRYILHRISVTARRILLIRNDKLFRSCRRKLMTISGKLSEEYRERGLKDFEIALDKLDSFEETYTSYYDSGRLDYLSSESDRVAS